ncbi:peptidylprolyl isomerase [Novosphingobium huizhouense]|uniref:peptidylprolyl isomerase n=1 Tax=Novosphingobium huizhouense TaxID=2866625 RepID=UPI001CD9168E|nr:peptidylprolyl isomerase [Novosphingobium huizhouense]
MHKTLFAAALLPLLAAAAPENEPPKALAPLEIVGQAPAADWSAIAPADLLVMDLAPDAAGKARRVVIQLLPPPFTQGWIGNIRKLAAAHWWDGTSINRVQDNYVVQWGDADGEDAAKAKPLPQGLATIPQAQYTVHAAPLGWVNPMHDAYASNTGVVLGWPVSYAPDGVTPVHCYGTVGVGRNMPPDTGTGAELYAVIGHAPRQLDRNIAVVGRVIEGIEHLSSLPRGTGDLGFYKTAAERTPIRAIRLGTDVPDLPRYQYLSTESASFARYADARANRRDPFYIRPAGGADICNIPVPVRRAP